MNYRYSTGDGEKNLTRKEIKAQKRTQAEARNLKTRAKTDAQIVPKREVKTNE